MSACLWSLGRVFCRAFVFLAVLGLFGEFAQPVRAHAGEGVQGFEIVICSDDGAVTITVDREGNPIEAPGEAACDSGCAACPSSGAVCLIRDAVALDVSLAFAAAVPCTLKSVNLACERGRLPVPRGPPTEKET
jgi:hypothetical protein